MQRRPLGRSGRTVSAIGLGCMGMSEFYGPSDDLQSLDTMAAAVDAGIDLFDTADMYGSGRNEELVGRFLRTHRDKVFVATKFGIVRSDNPEERRIDNSPDYIRKACKASLKRLGIDAIDLYYAHRRDRSVPIEDTVGAMADLVKAGLVRYIGLSEVSAETLRRAAAVHPIAALQTEYSLWTRDPERELLKTCRELGVTFVAYSPLGRAFLTGTIASPDGLAPDDFRRTNPRFQGEAFERNRHLAQQLADFAAKRNATPAQVALAWLLSKNPDVVPIPGTRRVKYVRENAAAADLRLSKEAIAELDAMFPPEAVAGERYAEIGMRTLEQ